MKRGARLCARGIAREVLGRVERDAAYANLALAAALDRQRDLSAPERALATELVYGVLRRRRLLDHALARHASRPLHKVDRELLNALRIAAYQILYLERVPTHAAVDQAVGAVRQLRGPKVAGFANAVLRKLSAEDVGACLPTDEMECCALLFSLPTELMRLLVRDLGRQEAESFAKSLLERAGLCVRVNAARADVGAVRRALEEEGAQVEQGCWLPGALRLVGLSQPFRTQSYLGGLWSAQDEAAQLAALMLDPQPGEDVLDGCAGVGGKTTHLGELLSARVALEDSARGSLLSADTSARKLSLLQEHGRRLGVPCETLCADLTETSALGERRFDKILLDAPCSGLGVLRRHPELKWRWREQQIGDLVALQRRLLTNVVEALRPAGTLVYSVCTVTESEGPDQLRWLLQSHPDLRLVPPPSSVPTALQQEGVVRTWPQRHGIDGFFIARVQRRRD